MDTTRILIIDRYHKALRLRTTLATPLCQREAAIWNIATVLIKHNNIPKAALHAPSTSRAFYLAEAKRRITRIRSWASRNPEAAQRICAPYLAEYARRATARSLGWPHRTPTPTEEAAVRS